LTWLVTKSQCGRAMTWHGSVDGVGAVVVVGLTPAWPNVGNGQGLDNDERSWVHPHL